VTLIPCNSDCLLLLLDGHDNQYAFSWQRLNLQVAIAAATHNGAIIVDSTRRGKAFPDSMRATVS
jgi:tRNA A64-2'-O-ribosylphosphate transferase